MLILKAFAPMAVRVEGKLALASRVPSKADAPTVASPSLKVKAATLELLKALSPMLFREALAGTVTVRAEELMFANANAPISVT